MTSFNFFFIHFLYFFKNIPIRSSKFNKKVINLFERLEQNC